MDIDYILSEIKFVNLTWTIIAPVLLIIFDVLSGVVIAWMNGDFQSSKMRQGLTKKFGEIIYIIVGIISRYAIGTDIILYFLVSYICFMELSSLIENCDKMGVKLPDKLKEKLNNESEVKK